jgi:excisionase family DNA binding protein
LQLEPSKFMAQHHIGGVVGLPTFYTPEEVAARLKVSRRAVYQWLTNGKLHGLRAGQGWRITEEDLLAFMNLEGPNSKKRNGRKAKRQG